MPVYHVDAFDVSAVQIDLSANVFNADSANLSADYWVRKKVNFNSGGAIRSDASLNFIFRNISHNSWGDLGNSDVSRNSAGTRSNIFADATTAISDSNGVRVKFKDLGVIKADHSLYTNALYSNVDTLRTNSSSTTTFVGKVNTRLQLVTSVTGLREKMLASINQFATNPDYDLSITDPVPAGEQFGFLVVRNLNLAGTSQDLATHIGVVLEQS